jgi:multiple sugar transport system ATP-binding protein
MADVRFTAATRLPPGAPRPAVDGLDLHVRSGELLVLAGASGSGKSTLLRMLSGLEPVDSGRISIGGRRLADLPRDRQWVSLVSEGSALLPTLTLYDNIALPLRLRRTPDRTARAAVARAADACGLRAPLSLHPDGLPFETRLRTTLARAVVRRPQVLCLDEPLAGPDACAEADSVAVIREAQRALGVTVIHATCRSADALALADRVAVLDHGRVHQIGRPRAVFDRPATATVARFAGPALVGLVCARVAMGTAWLGSFPVALTARQRSALSGDRVLVGLNPDRLLLVPTSPAIRATVVRVERDGRFHAVCAVARLDSTTACLRVARVTGQPPAVGDRVLIGAPPSGFNLYDPATGDRLPD